MSNKIYVKRGTVHIILQHIFSLCSARAQGTTSFMLVDPSMIFENSDSALPEATESVVNEIEALLRFNARMERMANVASLNEKAIEKLLDELERFGFPQDESYWLTLARINELILFCAGNYAASCDFALVGDLLLNPRLILAHVRGMDQPVVKKRHTPLTEQFSDMADSHFGVIEWLKANTVLETKKEALASELFKKLQDSGVIHKEYLESVDERKVKIAELSGLLCSRFRDGADFYAWLARADQADREYIETRLCRFDLELFFKLGKDVKALARAPRFQSSFLKVSISVYHAEISMTP